MDEETNVENETSLKSLEINKKLSELFGADIAKAFEEEEINCPLAIADLLERDADSQIFVKLGLTYGKALRFKREFEKLMPPSQRGKSRNVNRTTPPPSAKPSMGDLASFSPELRRLYLSKRKQVGVLASEHWQHKFPKFNTPEKKAELEQFAKKIAEECSLPEAGFFTDGIVQHIKAFFSEQRRFHKNKKKIVASLSCSESGSSSELEWTPPPKLPSMPKVNPSNTAKEDRFSPDSYEDRDDCSEGSTDTVILHNGLPGNEQDVDLQESSTAQPVSENKISRKSAMVIIKAVTGKIPDREELVKLLRGKFKVQSKSLTTLTVSQIMEVTARKLIVLKYVSLNQGISHGDIKNADITVHKEIDL